MKVEERVLARIDELILEGQRLRRGNQIGQQLSVEHGAQCSGWMAAALNSIQIVCTNPENSYRKQSERIIQNPRGLMIPTAVGDICDLLLNLKKDIGYGLVTSVANQARAETFDNFLDHAAAYHKDGRKSESGVIAGVVFEDGIRRICDKHLIAQKGQSLEDLIMHWSRLTSLLTQKLSAQKRLHMCELRPPMLNGMSLT